MADQRAARPLARTVDVIQGYVVGSTSPGADSGSKTRKDVYVWLLVTREEPYDGLHASKPRRPLPGLPGRVRGCAYPCPAGE